MSKSTLKKISIIALATLFIGSGGYFVYDRLISNDKPAETTDGVNYDPPTDQEKAEGNRRKQEIAKDEEAQKEAANNEGKKQVKPIISFWGQKYPGEPLEVGGYVGGVIEEGANCKLTLTKDGKEYTDTIKSVKNAQTTSCSTFTIPFGDLSKGTWQAKLNYSSATSQGVSDPMQMEVQ